MTKFRSDQQGFSVVETLLALIIVIVIVGVGGYVLHVKRTTDKNLTATTSGNPVFKKRNSSSSATTTANNDPYAGWKSATLTYEKISYQYPSNWTVTDSSAAMPQSANDCVYPGVDVISLTSPSDERVVLHTGIDCIGDGGAQSFGSVPIQSLGQSLYLAFENNVGDGPPAPTAPQFACLGQTSTPATPFDFKSKNIFFNGTGSGSQPANSFCYYPYDVSNVTTLPTESVSSIENSKDFLTAKLIFESMKY